MRPVEEDGEREWEGEDGANSSADADPAAATAVPTTTIAQDLARVRAEVSAAREREAEAVRVHGEGRTAACRWEEGVPKSGMRVRFKRWEEATRGPDRLEEVRAGVESWVREQERVREPDCSLAGAILRTTDARDDE